MYKNQYIAIPTRLGTIPSLPDFQEYIFFDLSVFHHRSLSLSARASSDSGVALLGLAVDPWKPQLSNQEIVDEIYKDCSQVSEFIEKVDRLSGRFVIFYKNKNRSIVYGDGCRLRRVFYDQVHRVITSSPRLFLEVFRLNVKINLSKRGYIESAEYLTLESPWYGDECVDDRLRQLMPNHYLDLERIEAVRVPPYTSVKDSKATPAAHALNIASIVLKGTIHALALRYDLIQPLTAGWDSRTLLAASRQDAKKIRYYVFGNNANLLNSDIVIPKRISDRLGLDFRILVPGALRSDFIDVYDGEHIMPRHLGKTSHIQYHYDNHKNDKTININGNGGEVVRCFFGETDKSITVEMLLTLSGLSKDAHYASEAINMWLVGALPHSIAMNIPILDLFYWEQRMGHWGSLYCTEQDIAIDEVSPFNNRYLLLTLLRVNSRERRGPRYAFFRALIKDLWPESLSEPINPGIAKRAKEIVSRYALARYAVLKLTAMLRQRT